MSKIKLSEGSKFINTAQEGVLLKVTKVDYKQDFGKIEIVLVNEKGSSITNNFVLSKNGKPNQGALNAFSYFVRAVLGNVGEIEPDDLLGKFVKADIVMNPGRPNEEGEVRYFANLNKVYTTSETFGETETSPVNKDEDNGWD